MAFNNVLARNVAAESCNNQGEEEGLIEAFVQVCNFLYDNPDSLSWRSNNKPSVETKEDLKILAEKYFSGYRKSDFPVAAGTIPDEIVSIVMMEAFGYSKEDTDRIKIDHQRAMIAENCVGALLERYLDSVLRREGWNWCCGNFVKAIDFVRRDENEWLALQIKDRDNSENSSSSAIRNNTTIEKWFRSFSKTGGTNWDNLPPLMQGFNLSEEGFTNFVRTYLAQKKPKP